MLRASTVAPLLVAAALLAVPQGQAAIWVIDGVPAIHEALQSEDATGSDVLGWSLAADAGTLVAGAPGATALGLNSGAADVFERQPDGAWRWTARLLAPDGGIADTFGNEVAVHGDVIVVGTERDNELADGAGAAWVFRRTGGSWVPEAKLLSPDPDMLDLFGRSVSVRGGVVAVGAWGDDGVFGQTGAVYIFRHGPSGWAFEQKLTAPEANPFDFLGVSVALGDGFVAAGAHGAFSSRGLAGVVHVFREGTDGWAHDAVLEGAEAEPFSGFGFAVAVEGDVVVTGAPTDRVSGVGTGAAYVFRHTPIGWRQEARLTPLLDHVLGGADQFGWDVDVRGQVALVGAPRQEYPTLAAPEPSSGALHAFAGPLWLELPPITDPEAEGGDRLGSAVALAEGSAFGGAPFDEPTFRGAVHRFALPGA